MKIAWHRTAVPHLQLPPVCAVTGAPAVGPVRIIFRKGWATFLPAIGRLVVNATNQPVVMNIPVCAAVRSRIMTWRLVGLFGLLLGVVLAFVLAGVVGGSAGALLFFVLLVVALGSGVLAQLQADVVGSDVDGDWISMRHAHPAFVQAVLAVNPPGVVFVEQTPAVPYA
jgi:hypothetical protein